MLKYVDIWSLKGRVVVIAEKPKAASKIASAVLPSYNKTLLYKVPVYFYRGRDIEIIIASAAGHLFNLNTRLRGYPVFSYDWTPLYETDPEAKHTYYYVKALNEVCKNADYYVNACDYDIEGSVIGFLIIKFFGNIEKAYRAKFSSLTPAELRDSFRKLSRLDFEMVEAGLARHELDWLWGINISRALMSAVESVVGKRIVLSAGRVQTPTLAYVVSLLQERNLHIPYPVFALSIVVEKNGSRITAHREKGLLDSKSDALRIASSIKKSGKVKVLEYIEKKKIIPPPYPFNLGDLQEEAYRIYGFSPYKTQELAEKLYLEALISYPRTNSQKLPPTLDYKGILIKLSSNPSYANLVRQLLSETGGVLKPREGPKDDPAHPAIYPTGVPPPRNLPSDMLKIYDLVVKRFLAVFSSHAEVVEQKVYFSTEIPGEVFVGEGEFLVRKGWLKYYDFYEIPEKKLPLFSRGEYVRVLDVSVRKKYTKPPAKPTKMSILRWMEHVEIGTESTRARIIETLFERGYLRTSSKGVDITDLGLGVTEVISEFFPELTKVDLTREFEKALEDIRLGKVKRQDVIDKAKKTIIELIARFERDKANVGRELAIRLNILKPPVSCKICSRQAYSNGLCKYHYMAYNKIIDGYKEWSRREEVSFSEYISLLASLKSSGKWIAEVAKAIRERKL
ncbi:DNA topoisomerase I [Thermogladius sp. 4427co]|uniref:DNA topoisomerase I n=1 Tax=Thermogladius sp. 4427co TaxID=3450718 RepID=UPI003F7A1686